MEFEKSKWIWTANKNVDMYVDFVCDFVASEDSKITLNICAATEYIAYINGKYLASGQYNSYPDKKYYDKIAITDNLIVGKNRISIIGYLVNIDTLTELKDDRGIIFEILDKNKIIVSSDDKIQVRESKEFVTKNDFIIVANIGYSIYYDANFYDGYRENGALLNGFSNACQTENKFKILARPIKKLVVEEYKSCFVKSMGLFKADDYILNTALKMQNAYLSEKKPFYFTKDYVVNPLFNGKKKYCFKHDGSDGIYLIIDLGEESTGHFMLDINVKTPTRIDYAWGEQLDDMRVRAEISGRSYASTFVAKKGENHYVNYFSRIGARYLMLFIYSNDIELSYAGIATSYYPLKIRSYKCESLLENKIYDVCIHTLKCCMHEHYEDCAWREQSQYIMDARTQILAGYYAFDNVEFAKASIILMSDFIYKDGQLPLTQPSDFILRIPNFTLCYFLVVNEYLRYTKDFSILNIVFQRLKFIINKFIEKLDSNYLLIREQSENIWHFFEWTENMSNNFGDNPIKKDSAEYALPYNAFMIMALDNFIEISGFMGESVASYIDIKEKMIKSTHKSFFIKEKGIYATYLTDGKLWHFSEYTQCLAILANLPDANQADKITNLIASDNDLIKMALSNYIFKYEALLKQNNAYKHFVRNEIEKVWGEMLFKGASTFYEVREGADAFYYAGSLCHGWSAIPIYIYKKYNLLDE